MYGLNNKLVCLFVCLSKPEDTSLLQYLLISGKLGNRNVTYLSVIYDYEYP